MIAYTANRISGKAFMYPDSTKVGAHLSLYKTRCDSDHHTPGG